MAQELSVIVSDEDRVRLEAIVGDRNRLLKHTQRARIVLLSAERLPVLQVAVRAGVSRPVVWRWQRRYAEAGAAGDCYCAGTRTASSEAPDGVSSARLISSIDRPLVSKPISRNISAACAYQNARNNKAGNSAEGTTFGLT